MAGKLTDFVLEMAAPDRLAKFQENADQILAEADLSPTEKLVLVSGDSNLIRKAIVSEIGDFGQDAAFDWVIVLVNVVTKAEL